MEKVEFRDSRKTLLKGELFLPFSKVASGKFPLVVYAHGLYSSGLSSKKSQAFLQVLVNAGFAFFRFDSYGVGESAGDFKNTTLTNRIDSLKNALHTALSRKEVFSDSVYLIGSSFGGLASLFVSSADRRVKALVLIAPAINLCYEDIPYERYPELAASFFADLKKYDPYNEAQKIGIPTLIIHGDCDEEVPYNFSVELVKHLRQAKLVTIKGADHRFASEIHFRDILENATTFLTELERHEEEKH
ncbi:MAG: alpha/beta fold hydrolase [Planctomycetota bacterium]|nr:alpha/beta fold hydrolase [Planctomycetota bacterium]